MDDEKDDESYIGTFIDMMRGAMPDKVISNYIFVAEVVGDKNNQLSIVTSNTITPWLAQGMLRAAEDMIISGVDSYADEQDEEDQ